MIELNQYEYARSSSDPIFCPSTSILSICIICPFPIGSKYKVKSSLVGAAPPLTSCSIPFTLNDSVFSSTLLTNSNVTLIAASLSSVGGKIALSKKDAGRNCEASPLFIAISFGIKLSKSRPTANGKNESSPKLTAKTASHGSVLHKPFSVMLNDESPISPKPYASCSKCSDNAQSASRVSVQSSFCATTSTYSIVSTVPGLMDREALPTVDEIRCEIATNDDMVFMLRIVNWSEFIWK